MAQVVWYFTATAKDPASGSNVYIYPSDDPDVSSSRHIPAGTPVEIYNNDGVPLLSNGRYRLRFGMEFINRWQVTTPIAVYRTVTDRCGAPTRLTLDTASKTLTASGGKGGDLNSFSGYEYAYRDRLASEGSEWGAWSAVTALGTGTTSVKTVSAPEAGYARQFRVRTKGSAGASYYSVWAVCSTLLYGNTAPQTPTVALPVSGATAVCPAPTVCISCPAEPDGGAQMLCRSLDGGAWSDICDVPSAGGVIYDTLPELTSGAHSVAYRMKDEYGAVSGDTGVAFTVSPATWARAISAGTVISNAEVSHCADIAELLAAVNAVRAFYGLAATSLPGSVGSFAAWKGQMEALQAGLDEAYSAAGKEAPAWLAVPAYPTAAIVNELRGRMV